MKQTSAVDKVAYQEAYVSSVMSSFHASTAHEGAQRRFDVPKSRQDRAREPLTELKI